jgi:hypothetical protein
LKTLVNIVRILIFIPIILVLIFHGSHGVSLAQDTELGLQIFIVPERVVCPNGYKRYHVGKGKFEEVRSNCPKLSHDDIDNIIAKYKPIMQVKDIPPQDVVLEPAIFQQLSNYRSFAGDENPDNRDSVVFVFTWKNAPPNSTVSLRRIVDFKYTDIPAMDWQDPLIGKYYIHHERADALDPGEKIKWQIELVGGLPWTFFATRNPK